MSLILVNFHHARPLMSAMMMELAKQHREAKPKTLFKQAARCVPKRPQLNVEPRDRYLSNFGSSEAL